MPTRGNVLLEIFNKGEELQGGVLLPDALTKERQAKGKVIEVGLFTLEEQVMRHKTSRFEPDIKVGDTVRFKRFASDTWKEDGKEYIIVGYKDILAVIE